MTGFTKLFGTLITSTLWREDDKTRIVWITMLALADRYGVVAASIPGLAAMSNVTVEETEAAIERLLDTDKHSRTKENDGRRIEVVDGGWFILNYAKYREMGRGVDRQEYLTQKKREERQRKKESTLVNKSTKVNQSQPIAEAEAEAEAEKTPIATTTPNSTAKTPKAGKPAKERVRNEFFDILAGAGNQNPDAMTESEGGRVARALSEIRKACPDLTTDELKRRIQNYRLTFPDAILTPTAISSNWSRLEVAPKGEYLGPNI